MDEVLEKLDSTTIGENTKKSNFDGLYKNWGKLGNQEERRKELLDVQRSNRNNKLDKLRGILDIVQAHHNVFNSYKAKYRPNIYVAGFSKVPQSYSNVLMMSEWLIEKPEDLKEEWLITPCPKGVRMLVVASDGLTKCYTKYGHYRFECRTALPGGNPCELGYRNKCCVLDCFYYEKLNMMYVLDLLAWNNQIMTDGETEFRNYWLQTQFAERPGLRVINKKNKFVFELLPKVPCTTESLNEFMMKYPHFKDNMPPLDGLLFYHKRAHYTGGETPLVGWLFPYMVPEVLGEDISVNKMFMQGKPADYINQADFIEKFEKKMVKKTRHSRLSSTMDTSDDGKTEVPEAVMESSEKTEDKIQEEDSSKTHEDMDAELNRSNFCTMKKNTKNRVRGNRTNLDFKNFFCFSVCTG
ncbi:hypothetical protein K1T71_001974 [Dendrolimus kikuchii]|uniref:Uncharacterized protein n=1 Tax=Dendrolimus kikuchii TaxID=765133 RepID=A0ACC1DFL3_9NEOP|nr:hypothetical protein K1T71_001974 [Dendrolimus kikuchii]